MQPDLQTDVQPPPHRARQRDPLGVNSTEQYSARHEQNSAGQHIVELNSHRQPAHVDIAAPSDASVMAQELAALPSAQRLYSAGSYEVFVARRAETPQCIEEIGRLREVSFRGVGEGTGFARDLDEYDNWYQHLMVWDSETRQILGAYRLGLTDSVLAEKRSAGLYCTSLFDFSGDFFERLGPAVELGRSFVRPKYQRSPRVLALLWKGIGRIVSLNPRYSRLFGAVSVSNSYAESSRQLIAHELMRPEYRHRLAEYVKSRRPVQADQVPVDIAQAPQALSPKALHKHVAEIEPSGEGLPILVREYMKLSGQFLEFSVDPDFGNAMDGLVCVDLSRTSQRLLSLYMGPEAAEQFRSKEPHR